MIRTFTPRLEILPTAQRQLWSALHLTGPDGVVLLDHVTTIARTQARHFAFAGIRRKTDTWQPGIYRGEITLVRENQEPAVRGTIQRTITIR